MISCLVGVVTVSFSIFTGCTLKLQVVVESLDEEKQCLDFSLAIPERKVSRMGVWSHFTWAITNNTILLFHNNRTLKHEPLYIIPYWMYVRQLHNHSLHWIQHKYNFKAATSTKLHQFSTLGLINLKNLCLGMFVSLDVGCELDLSIVLESGTVVYRKTIQGFNMEGTLKSWRHIEITLNGTGSGNLSLERKYSNSKKGHCFWAVDQIKYCEKTVTFHGVIPDKDCRDHFSCTMLTELNTRSSETIPSISLSQCKNRYGHSPLNCTSTDIACINNINIINRTAASTSHPGQTESSDGSSPTYSALLFIAAIIIIVIVAAVIIITMRYKLYKCVNTRTNNQNNADDIEMSELDELISFASQKIFLAQLGKFIKDSLSNSNYMDTFKGLQMKSNKPSLIGNRRQNRAKNYNERFIPYDETRVILETMHGVGEDDFINASYIDGYGRPKAYIAAQTPKSLTTKDFWRMIWQQDVQLIIMATTTREELKNKCVEYFPTILHAYIAFGELAIRLTSQNCTENFEHRTFELNYLAHFKTVQHYQLKWNPKNTNEPLYPNDIVPLVEIIEKNHDKISTPIVVHCSSGTERSALLILCHLALRMAKNEGYFDMYELLGKMRTFRPSLIKSVNDFILAHLVVQGFRKEINPGKNWLKQQKKQLYNYQYHDRIINGLQQEKTSEKTKEEKFILIDGYDHKHQYIPRMQPNSSSSLVEFWKFVLTNKIILIVFLDAPKLDLWPFAIPLTKTSTCSVVQKNSKNFPSYCVSQLLLKHDDLSTTTIYKAEITFVQFTKTSSNLLQSPVESFIQLVLDMSKLKEVPNHLNSPLLICDRDSIIGTGLFLSLTYVINKYLKEIIYDVYNAVRILRRIDPKYVADVGQIQFLHEAICIFSEKFDPYSGLNLNSQTQGK